MAGPGIRAAMSEVIAARPYQEVQDLAIRQEAENQPPVPSVVVDEAAVKAAEEAEAARVSAEAARVEAERKAAEQAAKKIVVEYQVRDDKGNPIGRFTHLE